MDQSQLSFVTLYKTELSHHLCLESGLNIQLLLLACLEGLLDLSLILLG